MITQGCCASTHQQAILSLHPNPDLILTLLQGLSKHLYLFKVYGRISKIKGQVATLKPLLTKDLYQYRRELIHVNITRNRATPKAQVSGSFIVVNASSTCIY
jgi:hypothetical protein